MKPVPLLMLMPLVLAAGGCTDAEKPTEPAAGAAAEPRRETVFAPLTDNLDRARGVQQTLDAAAAERRRRLEEQEGQ